MRGLFWSICFTTTNLVLSTTSCGGPEFLEGRSSGDAVEPDSAPRTKSDAALDGSQPSTDSVVAQDAGLTDSGNIPIPTPALPTIAPDIQTINDRYRFSATSRTVAVGDLHGDLRATRNILRMAKVIDGNDRWIAGDQTLVQVGDQLDRGNDDQAVLTLMATLAREADQVGGHVHTLNGNHEVMNVSADFRYVTFGSLLPFYTGRAEMFDDEDTNQYKQRFRSERDRLAADLQGSSVDGMIANVKFFLDQWGRPHMTEFGQSFHAELQKFRDKTIAYDPALNYEALLYNRAAIFAPGKANALVLSKQRIFVIVGDSVFVHGGITPESVSYGLSTMDDELRAWMEGKTTLRPSAALHEFGPLWHRKYATDESPAICNEVRQVLSALSVKRMVVGHTIQTQGITHRCGGAFWAIDVGLTHYYAKQLNVLPQYLEITGDHFPKVRTD